MGQVCEKKLLVWVYVCGGARVQLCVCVCVVLLSPGFVERENSHTLPTTTPAYFHRPWVPQASQPVLAPRTAEMQGDPFGLLLRQRTIFMGGEVEDFGADAIISQLLLLDSQDPSKDIKLFINSPGMASCCCRL